MTTRLLKKFAHFSRSMMKTVLAKLRDFLAHFNVEIYKKGLRVRQLQQLVAEKHNSVENWKRSTAPKELKDFIIDNVHLSFAQLQQDVLALYIFKKINQISSTESRVPFFVEFGATNGVELSNTLMLEKYFGWSGILCEPAKIWHQDLLSHRKSKIDFRCVSDISNKYLTFEEMRIPSLSSLREFSDSDFHSSNRKVHRSYKVRSVSLNDLLEQNDAPKYIDFISIDTEGNELEILKNFSFDKWSVSFFAIEHNFSRNRDAISRLLESKGYARVLTEVSTHDYWFVRQVHEIFK